MANLLLSVMDAFAEFERELIRERQREGIALAKLRGAYRGRKPALNHAQRGGWMSAAKAEPHRSRVESRASGRSRFTRTSWLV